VAGAFLNRTRQMRPTSSRIPQEQGLP
jgi:hypothetical protein